MGGRGQTLLKGTPEQIRAMASASAQFLGSLAPAIKSTAVTSEDGQHNGLKYRIYRPQQGNELPIGVWAHGGGLMIGDLDTDDHLCRVLAENVPCILVNVDYRLSPEHRVPTHLEDVRTLCLWVSISEVPQIPNIR